MACSKLIQIHTTSTKILYLLNTMYGTSCSARFIFKIRQTEKYIIHLNKTWFR